LYAFVYDDPNPADPNSIITETIATPASLTGKSTPNVATRVMEPFNPGDPFPPNLDFIGFKQHPGVCFTCHGGNPKNLTSTGAYPNQGKVSGFRYLPLDIRNLLFTSDLGPDQPAKSVNGSLAFTDRANQELQIKVYNQAVLKTVPTGKSSDGTGATRVAHMREVIEGWYAGGRNTQDADFVPVAWREPADGGTAPPGSKHLYQTVVAPSCRSCHFNREISLDFGTPANFKQESDVLEYSLLPGCSLVRPSVYKANPNAKFMPLAHLTFQKVYQANQTVQVLPFPAPALNLFNTIEQIANYFGFNGLSGYCATNP
jgi:hypothetical protein